MKTQSALFPLAFAVLLAGCASPVQTPSVQTPRVQTSPAAKTPSVNAGSFAVGSKFSAPDSPRAVYNFNPGWKFAFGDSSGADKPEFDDSAWTAVSLPHTWNETDTYRALISHGGGDQSEKMLGIGWYRKHFKLPASADGQKVFLEFDGLRQAGRFFLNGQAIGKYENGVTPLGLDITRFVNFGGKDNVLAVKVDNSPGYKEEATGTAFEWNAKDFNPNFGGLNRDAKLIVAGKIYQTLPLYENLQTTGIYIYPQAIDLNKKTADVKVEAEAVNETADYASITLSAVVVDADGIVRAKIEGDPTDLVGGQSETLTASGSLSGARFWDVNDPYLYKVYTILTVNGAVGDVCETQTGFRKTEFKGGAGTGGVWLNGRFVWLTGYSQRSADDWPGFGGAYPDWMHEFTLAMIRESNGNYLRWMHVSPERADVAGCDRFGIVEVCPAGDKEREVTGRQWDQRVEVMRDAMIFYRNNPSIFFWEAGNTIVTPEEMVQMVALRKQWDPNGGRVMGTRDNDLSDANKALTPMSEYYGVMIGQAPQTDKIAGDDIFRGYSVARRDKAPLIETEDFRDEAGRNVWDDYSPPHFGFKPKAGSIGGRPVDSWHWNSETFCLAGATRYVSYVRNRIDNPDPAHSKWSAYSSIYFTDSDADGRQQGSYVLRVSGKVDGVRLPKQMFFVSRVMQNEKPDIHIIGHWTYPANTKKTMYVAATHCDQVELFLNGKSLGVQTQPTTFVDTYRGGGRQQGSELLSGVDTGYIYAFPDIAFVPGTLKAVATKGGQVVAQTELETAGAPAAIRLTVHAGPQGLIADGSDVVLVDFEVVDAQGRRCPTDEGRVDFAISGPAVWRGGLNAAMLNSTNNLYLSTECGINRVAIRSTQTPGTITLTATREGLTPASVQIESQATEIVNGLETQLPQTFAGLEQKIPGLVP
jgi:beta-galactosidase